MAKTFLDTIDPEENPEVAAAVIKIGELIEAAQAAYTDYRLNTAIDLYTEAVEIADVFEIIELVVHIRSRCSECLKIEGRVTEALSMLAPLLQIDPSEIEPDDYFNALTEYIEIAIVIPCSIQTIEKAFAIAENLIGDKSGWKSMLLFLRSNLFYLQGNFLKSLDFAKEAWALWRDEYPNFSEDSYLTIIVTQCLELEDLELAKYYIQQWENQENSSPTFREAVVANLRARLELAEGNLGKASDLFQTSFSAARQVGGEDIFSKIIIESGKSDEICEILSSIRYLVRNPIIDLKYRLYSLIGSVHAVYAGFTVKEFGINLTALYEPRASNETEKEKHTNRAAFFYRMALKAGQEFDRRLECDWRRRETEKRLAVIGRWEE
jgi:tetratricopeptide (TPR) repeat protein